MRSLGLLALALNASALLLLAQGSRRSKEGLYTDAAQRLPAPDRPLTHHLPTYMMHLYRNFRSNFSRPLDTLEPSAAQQADTVQSVMAKSKLLLLSFSTPLILTCLSKITVKMCVRSRGSVRTWSSLAQVTPCQKLRSQTTTEGLNPHLTPRLSSRGCEGITMKGSACEILCLIHKANLPPHLTPP